MVQVAGKGGDLFWVPISLDGELPVVAVHEGVPMAGVASVRSNRGNGENAPKDEPVFDSGGGVMISPSIVKAATEERKQNALRFLHLSLGHANGRKLYLTLEEKGLGGV